MIKLWHDDVLHTQLEDFLSYSQKRNWVKSMYHKENITEKTEKLEPSSFSAEFTMTYPLTGATYSQTRGLASLSLHIYKTQ